MEKRIEQADLDKIRGMMKEQKRHQRAFAKGQLDLQEYTESLEEKYAAYGATLDPNKGVFIIEDTQPSNNKKVESVPAKS